MNSCDHLILGWGFTAKYLKQWILHKEPGANVQITSRTHPAGVPFDLADVSTWGNLPQATVAYWTFPPEPQDICMEFYQKYKKQFGQIVVVGSTSAIAVHHPGEVVNEDSPLTGDTERARTEEALQNLGAILVLSSGMYGEGRNPLSWIEKGYVGKSKKWVNMIHGEDLAQFLYQAGRLGQAGQRYIASDNNPQQWDHVITHWENRGLLGPASTKESRRTSKRIDCNRSIKDLQVNLKFQNFADAVS